MLKPSDKVNLVYYVEYEGKTEQVSTSEWVVEEYDDGLLKVTKEPEPLRTTKDVLKELGVLEDVVEVASNEPEQEFVTEKKTEIFNLRSIGFLKVELV